jgi:TonB family protein
MRSGFSIMLLLFALCARVERSVANSGPPPAAHPPWESRYHALSMPAPIYPYEARRQHLTVSGVIAVDIDTTIGLVTGATMKKSTSSAILDEASLSVTKKWHFRPGGSSHLDVPVRFGIEGGRLE